MAAIQTTTKQMMKHSQWKRREQIAGWLFAAPALIGFLALTLLPMLFSLYWSMTDFNVFKQQTSFIGLTNYQKMFSSKDLYFSDSLKATAYYALLNVPASILFSFILALMLSTNIKGRGIFRSLFYLPSIIPTVASCMVWVWLLNQQYGLINVVLKAIGITPPGWIWDKNTVIPTLVMINLWNTGGTMVIFLAGIMNIPKVYYEAITVDGGNAFHKIIYITIPMVTPTIFFNTIMAIINSLQVFTQGYIMTSGGPGNASLFYCLYLYREAFQNAEMGYACALAWLLFIIVLALTMLVMKSQNKWVYYEDGGNN
ncbi:MAG: carbohydrate ABC transporter permease [Christensenellales bacterium]